MKGLPCGRHCTDTEGRAWYIEGPTCSQFSGQSTVCEARVARDEAREAWQGPELWVALIAQQGARILSLWGDGVSQKEVTC